MNCSLMRWIGALLFCGAVLFAQEAPHATDKQPQVFGPFEILTDTQGVDFGPYLRLVVQTVKHNWLQLIPQSAMPPIMKEGKLAIEFVILKNGNVSSMEIDASSGDIAMDRAAWGGITRSNPFPPLPKEFTGPNIGLRFHFYYNPKRDDLHELPPEARSQPNNPTFEVQVVAGSSHQFTNTPDGIPTNSAAWTVTGPGCSGAGCGSISAGLYTAPTKVPDPPRVTVTATSLSDASKTNSVRVLIVEPNTSQQ